VNWTVLFHHDFDGEFASFAEDLQDELLAHAKLLAQFGPNLGRPTVDTLKASRHANMKELRFAWSGEVWRVAFALDPKRQAILLVGLVGFLQDFAQHILHPRRQCGQSLPEVIFQHAAGVAGEQSRESGDDGIALLRQGVVQPVQGLDDLHGRVSSPVQPAGGRQAKLDGEVAKLNGTQASIGMHHHLGRHRIGQPQGIGSGHAVDQHTNLVSAADRINHAAVVWCCSLAGQCIVSGLVVEAAIHTPQISRCHQAL